MASDARPLKSSAIPKTKWPNAKLGLISMAFLAALIDCSNRSENTLTIASA